jgi:hypothetical protein
MVEMLHKEIQNVCNFSFLKIVKVEPANKVQFIFLEREAFSARKTLLFGTIFFYLKNIYMNNFFVMPGLPSNEKNSSDHHNSCNKGSNLASFSFTKNPSNSLPTIKFPKNHITSSYHSNMPKNSKGQNLGS